MKGIKEWAKDLKHNEKVAKKFEGVKSVEDILNVAHKEGYEFTERELLDFDLDSVAGGTGENSRTKDITTKLDVVVKNLGVSGTATSGSTVTYSDVDIKQS